MTIERLQRTPTTSGAARTGRHVIICGTTPHAVEVALLLLRFDEAVIVISDELGEASRAALERGGAAIIDAPADDEHALLLANIADASCAVIALATDLACVERALSIHARYPALPLVCHVADLELASRVESAVGARSAVCVSAIEAVHLAATAVAPAVIGAFPLGDGFCVVRRQQTAHEESVGSFESRSGTRILIAERLAERPLVAPHASMFLPKASEVVVVEHFTSKPTRISDEIARAGIRAIRMVRQSTPAPLAWTALILTLLAALSIVVFMAGMEINFSDAAYLVLNTISTVGYGDITPFDSGRPMRLFGSFVTLLGPALVGTILLIFARVVLQPVTSPVPSGGHVVIAASPQVSHAAAARLRALSVEAVAPHVGVSVTDALRAANVSTASAIVAATGDAVTNVNLALAARGDNPSIRVVVGGAERIAAGMSMAAATNPLPAAVATTAASALVDGVRYALQIDDRLFTFFEGKAGSEWSGLRPADVAGSYNFMFLYRRDQHGSWRSVDRSEEFQADETIMVVAWRRCRES
jgi:voltage-gated potassium channel Kch